MLPATGREGEPPEWPLVDPTERELTLWRATWRRPQAVEWERCWLALEVALYVRYLAAAELPGAPVTLGTLVRQMADSLGLTVPGLRANRWQVGAVEPEPRVRASVTEIRPSTRTRLKGPGGAGPAPLSGR